MKHLIAKLEAASEGSRELDFEIRQAVEGWENIGGGYRQLADGKIERYNYTAPTSAYTTSLTDAKTLSLMGWDWSVSYADGDCATGAVMNEHLCHASMAATPELALSAAWLRARLS